jgi:hypothetical protein
MSGRKKHRVIVEVTFDKNVTAKDAVSAVRCGCSRDEMLGYGFQVQAIKVKEAERVIQAELRWRGKVKDEPVRDID